MYSTDHESLDIAFPTSGSRLLSESPLLPSGSSSSRHNIGDLSISELSLSDRTPTSQNLKPFRLLAHEDSVASATSGSHTDDDKEPEDDDDVAGLKNSEDAEKNKRDAARLRDEKLQSDIFILKKLNASFASFNEALDSAQSENQVSLNM